MNILLKTPPLSQIVLNDWQLVQVSGIDAQTYLQGQLTQDMNNVTEQTFVFAAHCDAKGKVWGNLLLWRSEQTFFYLIKKEIAAQQISELKKYAIFSKVTIEATETYTLIGIIGPADELAKSPLTQHFTPSQSLASLPQVSILKLNQPSVRYLLVVPTAHLTDIVTTLLGQHPPYGQTMQWQCLDILADMPQLAPATVDQFLPQALSLEKLQAISFDKGCYCGQEMVARAEYRGINKRALYKLMGNSPCLPAIGDSLEQKLGDNWRESGTVLAALRLDAQQILIQAVLSHDQEPDGQWRVKQQPTSQLTIQTPPR